MPSLRQSGPRNAPLPGVGLPCPSSRPRQFRGLWDSWKNPETGEPAISCAIIVTDTEIERWLGGEAGTELLNPVAENRLRMWPVSRRVNKTGTGDDDPTLLDEVAA
jgi:putative SOS response-associated peptidase YedK